jgi:uncharacterized protein (UPF0335 family)
MALTRVPDGQGGFRHEFRPVTAQPAGRKRKARVAPDPIRANPDAAAQQLQQFIERRERLEEEKAGIADDIRDVNAEAKAVGFDVKTITAIIALRKMNPDLRREAQDILETYKSALGID